jgi:hypothetical protein
MFIKQVKCLDFAFFVRWKDILGISLMATPNRCQIRSGAFYYRTYCDSSSDADDRRKCEESKAKAARHAQALLNILFQQGPAKVKTPPRESKFTNDENEYKRWCQAP